MSARRPSRGMLPVARGRDRRSYGVLCGRAGGAAACGPCRSYGKRPERVSHSSLDGAQNAPPTTAHRHSSFGVLKREKQERLQ
jgi:hypothetical protein